MKFSQALKDPIKELFFWKLQEKFSLRKENTVEKIVSTTLEEK